MMTGLFCSGLIQFGINPIFQITKRTTPLIAAAVVACVVDPLLVLILPRSSDASSLAIAQAGAFGAALVTLIFFACASKPQWPSVRDLATTALGTAAMAAALLPFRAEAPGIVTLIVQVMAGVFVYGLLVVLLDIAGLRALVLGYLRPVVQRLRTL